MPTHFRWVWYLMGLAGMALMTVGILAILGSAAELGILVPLVFGAAVVIGYVLIRFRRSLDAAVAAAPSRQAGIAPAAGSPPDRDAGEPEVTTPASVTGRSPAGDGATQGASSAGPGAKKPPDGPPRTSRR